MGRSTYGRSMGAPTQGGNQLQVEGNVFNIQRFSVHDGPGIRTTVFLKGCNLRCAWCHNPESYSPQYQIKFDATKCVGCGTCKAVCPEHLPMMDDLEATKAGCTGCGKCENNCLQDALHLFGSRQSVEQIMDIVRKDKDYYDSSGGGLTVSGGEPMLQPEFVKALFAAAQKEGIHTALDTAGNLPFSRYEMVLPYTDLVLLDLKAMDSATHKQYTAVPNEQILETGKAILDSGVKVHIRTPLMAGVNDSLENGKAMANFLAGYANVEEVKLLPYHDMGLGKAEGLGMEMAQFAPPTQERLDALADILKDFIKEAPKL